MASPPCGRATCDSPAAIRLLGRAPSGARRLCFGLLLHLFCLRMSLFASVLCTLEDILPDRGPLTGGYTLRHFRGETAYIFSNHA